MVLAILLVSACTLQVPDEDNDTSQWTEYEIAESGLTLQHPSDLTAKAMHAELEGFDTGKMQNISLSGAYEGLEIDFEMTFTSSDYEMAFPEGTNTVYAKAPIDLTQSTADLEKALKENYYDALSVEKISAGSLNAVHFAMVAKYGWVDYIETILMPLKDLGNGTYTNVAFAVRRNEFSTDTLSQNTENFGSFPEEQESEIPTYGKAWMTGLSADDQARLDLALEILGSMESL